MWKDFDGSAYRLFMNIYKSVDVKAIVLLLRNMVVLDSWSQFACLEQS